MAQREPQAGSGRLAAVMNRQAVGAGPAVPSPDPSVDGPTVPLPVPARSTSWRARLADRWLPAGWRGVRLDPGRPGGIALLVVAAVGAVLAAVGVWREAPRTEPVPDLPALVETTTAPASSGPAASTGRSPAPAPTPPELIVVAVAGRVARPGLVRVPAGSRVADVLVAAGGALPGTDLADVNLARKVSDGEQVAVGVPGAPDAAPAGPAPSAGGAAPADGPLDLNAATVEQLDSLPGVGPVTAQRIVDWRNQNGRFATVDQLREVDGIGERRFEQLRGLVRV